MNLNITIPEYQSKSTSISPQPRKLSELPQEGLLNPMNFNRMNPSIAGGSANRLFRKIEDMMDLSLPYNHYRCLSPSESNLTQCNTDFKHQFNSQKFENLNPNAISGITAGNSKPGSTRFLRRQFSLDKDDASNQSNQTQGQNQIHHKQSLDGIMAQEIIAQITSSTASSHLPSRPSLLHKQNSSSIAQDLEKIEEIPISPSSQYNYDNESISSRKIKSLDRCNSERSKEKSDGMTNIEMQTSTSNSKSEIKLSVEALITR